ncbi:MAG: nucleotidyltransferase domain-containing protein [bacterium]|nr:nucleotidyltransferase domain-containing protein [bacterium]
MKTKIDYNHEIELFVEKTVKCYFPNRIILFGSAAKGKFREGSDIDLIVIKETRKPFWSRLKEISKFCSHKVGMDVLVYTPKEFEYLTKSRLFFKEEVLKKGKIVYEQ